VLTTKWEDDTAAEKHKSQIDGKFKSSMFHEAVHF
jgi:hypothetical protein